MRTIGYDAVMSAEAMAKYRIESADLDDIWAQSDFITFHTPLNDQTRDLINQQTLAKCKDGVFIVNCARGGIVNEEALLEALDSGKVRGAALDVFSSEPPTGVAKKLVEHPAVVSTPHLGASTAEAQTNVVRDPSLCSVGRMRACECSHIGVGCIGARHRTVCCRRA